MNNRRTNYSAKKKSGKYGYRVIFLLLVIAVLAGAGYVGYQYHRYPTRYPVLQSFSLRVNQWWVERKAKIKDKLDKQQKTTHSLAKLETKRKTTTNDDQLHFEFYTMLPNPDKRPAVLAESKQDDEKTTKSIFSQDALEKEFAKEITKTAYVIQTGIYSNAASAEKTQQQLEGDGLAAKVVKAYIEDRLVYRVQVGPYEEKERLDEAQSKLAARGVSGTLHKVEERVA